MENSELSRWVSDRLATLDSGEWTPDAQEALREVTRRRSSEQGRTRRIILAVAAASVALASVLVYPSTRALAQRCVAACVDETVRLTGLIRPTRVVSQSQHEIAPELVLTKADGTQVRLSDLGGKVVVLNFWATWCYPCRVEIPWFVEFQRAYREEGLEVLGVAFDEDGWNSVKPFMQKQRINYTVGIGSDEIARRYGIQELPVTLLIDRAGRIASRHTGLIDRSIYEREIQSLIAQSDHGVDARGAAGGQQDRHTRGRQQGE